MNKSRASKMIALVVMMFSLCTIYYLPYLMYYYYTPLQEFFGLVGRDADYGKLLNIYGIANLILYIPGGYICDRFDAKGLLAFSMIGTGILGILEVPFHGSYTMLVIIYILFAVTTVLTYWSASIKVINVISAADEQGSMYGFLESGRGIVALITSTIFVGIFTLTQSMQGILIGAGLVMIVIGVAIIFLFPKTNSAGTTNESLKDSLMAYVEAFKNPSTYLLAGMIWAACIAMGSKSYFAPFLEQVLGADVRITTAFTQYAGTICQIAGAAVGAMMSTKMGRSSKPIIYFGVSLALAFVVLMVLPGTAAMVIPILIFMIVAIFSYYIFRGLYYATLDESGTPKNTVGSVVAIASIIGFLPDTFWTSTVGGWIEAQGLAVAINKVYLVCAISAVVGLVCAIIMDRRIVKYRQENN